MGLPYTGLPIRPGVVPGGSGLIGIYMAVPRVVSGMGGPRNLGRLSGPASPRPGAAAPRAAAQWPRPSGRHRGAARVARVTRGGVCEEKAEGGSFHEHVESRHGILEWRYRI